jgi:hypothetical protein
MWREERLVTKGPRLLRWSMVKGILVGDVMGIKGVERSQP